MVEPDTKSLAQSRWSRRTGNTINLICLIALLVVIGVDVYGFALRAHYEHSYYAAVVIAIMGALVLLLAMAQQAIAGRDAATWRQMATWQIRAARNRLAERGQNDLIEPEGEVDQDSPVYYEHLLETLLENVHQHDKEEPGHGG